MSSFTRRAPREWTRATRTHAYPIPPRGRTHTQARDARCVYVYVWVRKMAMDRTMYGKVEPGDIYQPYRITMKKGSPPGCKSFFLTHTCCKIIIKRCKFFLFFFVFEEKIEKKLANCMCVLFPINSSCLFRLINYI